MYYLATAIVVLMLFGVAVTAVAPLLGLQGAPWWRRLATGLGSVLLLSGAGGFFGNALSATGAFTRLPPTFQWPAGYCGSILTTPQGLNIVLHASSQVQLYDRQWRYLRGWHVPAGGGTMHVIAVDDHTLQIVTPRGQRHFTYTIDGTLVSATTYQNRSDLPPALPTRAGWVPTAPWLLPFTHPIAGWLCIALGLVLLGVTNASRKAAHGPADSTAQAEP